MRPRPRHRAWGRGGADAAAASEPELEIPGRGGPGPINKFVQRGNNDVAAAIFRVRCISHELFLNLFRAHIDRLIAHKVVMRKNRIPLLISCGAGAT